MEVREDYKVKRSGSWEQIKFRLNENLLKRNNCCSASPALSDFVSAGCSGEELKPSGALFKS